ncbi:7433_t:CDS:2, partial [Entrophospora sp. SA101]
EYNKYGKGDGDMDFETSGVLPLTPLTNGDDVLGRKRRRRHNHNLDEGRKEFVIVREVFNVEDRINCNDNNESDDSSDDNYTLTPDSLHDIGTDSTMLTSDWPFPSSTTSSSSSINVDNIFTIEQQASMKIPFTIWEDPEADDT